jgi:hypothetical protein
MNFGEYRISESLLTRTNANVNTLPEELMKITKKGDSPRNFLSNLLNILAVHNNLRPGAILALNLDSPEQTEEFISYLRTLHIEGKKHLQGSNAMIIMNTSNEALRPVFEKLTKNTLGSFHTNVGKILGYLEPMNVRNKTAQRTSVGIFVTLRLPTGTFEVQHVPQRISVVTPEILETIETYKKKLRTMPMPDGFTIDNVRVEIKMMGGKTPRRTPSVRRNKTEKKSRK